VLEDTELDVPLTDVPRDDPETVSDDLVEVHHATVTHALGEATRERCPGCRDLREARRLAHREDLPARGRDDLAYELGQLVGRQRVPLSVGRGGEMGPMESSGHGGDLGAKPALPLDGCIGSLTSRGGDPDFLPVVSLELHGSAFHASTLEYVTT